MWLYDRTGRSYLDATAGLWYCNVGHGRGEIIDAIAAQMRRLDVYYVFNDVSNAPAEELAWQLSELSPVPGSKVFLTSGGGEAIDTAAKMARLYWALQGHPERSYLLSRRRSFHGTNGFGTSIAGIDANRAGFGGLIPDSYRVAFDDVESLRAVISDLGPDRIAALFVEPVQGAGGVHAPAPGYLESIARICREHGILLVTDSVIGGFGRLGDWFGVARWDLTPDMIVFAKGVTSGYQPLGGLVVTPEVSEPFWEVPGRPFRHGPTYSGHPAAAAAALANIAILEREALPTRSREMESVLADELSPLRDHGAVAEIRAGTGLLAAVELNRELLARDPGAIGRVTAGMRERGVLVRPLASSIAVSPPLTIQPAELKMIGQVFREALDAYQAEQR